MATRTTVLGRVTSVAGTTVYVLGFVPTTDTWIAKSVAVFNNSANAATVAVAFQDSTGTIFGPLLSQSVPANSIVNTQVWVVGRPGDELVATISGPSVSVWVSGADLPGHV